MFRVQLTSNTTNKNPTAEKLLLVKDFDTLKKQSAQKYKINQSKIRLFIAKKIINAEIGTEVTNDEQFQTMICDDMMITVSNGEDFKRKVIKNKDIVVTSEMLNKIKRPPKYPFPGKQNVITIQDISEDIIQYNVDLKETNYDKNFCGIFPVFEGNVLNTIKKIVSKYEKIKMIEENGFISFDYDNNMIFPVVNSWDDALVRECRGLIISSVTGRVLARRFHKFFNINEKNESDMTNINFNNCIAYEKLDGTLTSPVLRDKGDIIWVTRRKKNIEIEQIALKSDIKYNEFSRKWLEKNITPIFEYCHDTLPSGVLCYPSKELVLLALRDNKNGNYLSIEEVRETCNIPVVNKIQFVTINNLFNETKKLVNKEGIVIYTQDGQLYKCKSDWYLTMVRSQNTGKTFLSEFVRTTNSLKDIPINKIFIFAIQNDDDEMANVCNNLIDAKQVKEIRNFTQIIQKSILLLEGQLKDWLLSGFKIIQDKNVLLNVGESAGWDIDMLNDIFKSKSVTNKLKTYLIELCKQQKSNIVSELLDIDWNTNKCEIDTKNIMMPELGTFETCNINIQNHVITKYLPKKIANILGYKQISDNTIINIPSSYVGSEGKLIGMYESIAEKYGIYDLRVDLQSPRKEYSIHDGNSEYANLQIQSGKFAESSISYAGILIPTNSDIPYIDIVSALLESFEKRVLIKLKKRMMSDSKYKIFCDLDGVIVDFDKGILELTGKPVEMQSSSKLWQRVASCQDFFEKLDFTPWGKKLWEEINTISNVQPIILTGIPSSTNKRYETEKKNWVKNNLGSKIETITCNSNDKYKYASYNHILIDDRLEMGRPWMANGGIFIHHVTYDRTIYQLMKIFKPDELEKQKKHLEFFESNSLIDYENNFKVVFVTDSWPEIQGPIITFDSEWNHNSENGCEIIQIGTNDIVYIIDVPNASNIVKEQVRLLLENDKILKICFGVSEEESFRLGCDIMNIIDIQEVSIDSFNNFNSGYSPSLELITGSMLIKKLNKSKEISLSDWSIRPLTQQQIKYASNDVTVLFELKEKMDCLIKAHHIKNIYNSKTLTIKKNRVDFNNDLPVKIQSIGIFLTPSSKNELLEKIEPKYKNVHAIFAIYKLDPSKKEMDSFKIGEMISFNLISELDDGESQVVKCEYNAKIFYIYLATTNDLLDESKIFGNIRKFNVDTLDSFKNIKLFGKIGVFVIRNADELATLPEKTKSKILKFNEQAQPDENLKFKPNELSAIERSIIHEYARNNNMTSESMGKNTDRQLVLTKKRITNNSNLNKLINNEKIEKIKVMDLQQYSMLKIIFEEIQIKYDAYIENDNITINNEKLRRLLENKNKLIILRGIPGSGKSHLTNCFSDAEICSADDYFCENGEYKFNRDELSKAHDYCYNMCVEYLHKKCNTIIVDNTNATLKEYQKYINAGNCFNFHVIILEIPCNGIEQAKEFNERCAHGVSLNDELKMYSRWETDDNAFKIEPYYDNSKIKNNKIDSNRMSLHQWLTEKKLYHFSKIRNKSHMIMAIGNNSASFLDIPDNLYDEFCYKYANAIDNNEHMYIMEYSSRYPNFRLFIDFDYVNDKELSKEEIINYAKTLQLLMVKDDSSKEIYITGFTSEHNGKIKTGLHFKCPNYLVTQEEAITITKLYKDLLVSLNDKIKWDNVIDYSVYRNNCGIRMYGSRKATNSVDVGRVHKLMLIIDENGNEIQKNIDTHELVRILSIYNK